MNNGWHKRFTDNSLEIGRDSDPDTSWTRGRLVGMEGAAIHHDHTHIAISGPGEYWQSDDYESSMITGETRMVTRRLQKRISPSDNKIRNLKTENSVMLSVERGIDLLSSPVIPIIDKVGQWLTIELNAETGEVHWFYSKDKL